MPFKCLSTVFNLFSKTREIKSGSFDVIRSKRFPVALQLILRGNCCHGSDVKAIVNLWTSAPNANQSTFNAIQILNAEFEGMQCSFKKPKAFVEPFYIKVF